MSDQHPGDGLDLLYAGAQSGDLARLKTLIADDAYVLTDAADGERRGGEQVAQALMDTFHAGMRAGANRQIKRQRSISASASGRAAWAFEQVELEQVVGGATISVSFRFTLLLARADDGWRLAAGHWSSPISNEASHALVERGKLPTAVALDDDVAESAAPFVNALGDALADPAIIPSLYSAGDDVRAVGSAADEVFVGSNVRSAWEEFIGYGPKLGWRGGRVAALVEPEVGWMASHIDITFDKTRPYRFFYIWRREEGGWRVALSHDSLPTH
jgi:hypothetical protein